MHMQLRLQLRLRYLFTSEDRLLGKPVNDILDLVI